MTRLRQFFINGMIMTATSLTMSSIGVWFSVFVSNSIGAEAMGTYQLIVSVYSFAVTLATSGIGFATTRLISEEIGASKLGGIKKSLVKCVTYALTFSIIATLALLLFAKPIGEKVLSNPDTIFPMQIMAIGLPFLSVASVFGGYFTAVRRVVKNSAVQIFEQLLRIVITIIALSVVPKDNMMFVCLAIGVSGVLAEIMSFVSSFVLYKFDSKRYKTEKEFSKGLSKKMMSIALPIALSSYLRSGLLTLKNLLVPLRLQKSGLSQGAAVSFFGLMHGVVLPILLFPSAFISSFSGLVIPELAEYRARDGKVIGNKSIYYVIGRMFTINLMFSLCTAAVLCNFAEPLSASMSDDPNTVLLIKLMAPIVPIMYVDNCVDCILKGLNEQLSSMKYNIIDAAVSLVLVTFLLPVTGIAGYVIIICTSEILNFVLSLNRLVKITKFKINVANCFIKPIFAAVASCVTCAFLKTDSTLSLVFAILVQILVYTLVLTLTKALTKEDVKWFKKIFKKDHEKCINV